MNETIDLLQRHRSIRKYQPTPLTDEQKRAIIQSAQMASSSSNIQAYSVIGVTDPELKKQLAHLTGDQSYVAECGLFLVWCADLYRLQQACAKHGVEMQHQYVESFLVSTVDVALAAQNAAVAAEALGLGIVYIGGIRQNPAAVSELLKLPQLVYPVFGMCVGVPDQEPSHRPRLSTAAVYHENAYQPSQIAEGIEDYDQTMRDYYRERSGGKIDTTWSKQISEKYAHPARAHMRAFLDDQGFGFE
ncbi:FMN reductase (NADPH) [Tumebacillus sp. BK434]|uniref:oxygen-insensitive NADPH nitroreductase n=1 Tax=Tumebacillus sp. BK434 TaxID=2512169 RepID=UPI001042B542|nr:oxygen-insensitive NADPH nitroreductase [Tumebacillus sp. BK434]TCP58055.1 FMN reductase (NADPH) [Tumebacillus sp. BK434]